MKTLISFSIPALKIGKIIGAPISLGEIPKPILNKLIKSGHVSAPPTPPKLTIKTKNTDK